VERPARRLHDAALDLIANAVGIDRLAAIDGRHCAQYFNAPRFAVDLDVDRKREVCTEILVTREREAASAAFAYRVCGPAESHGGHRDDVACPRIVQMTQTEIDWINTRRGGQFIDEALDREDVRVRTERAQGGHANRHRRDEMMDDARARKLVQ